MGKWDRGIHNRTLLAVRHIRDTGKAQIIWRDSGVHTKVEVAPLSEQNCSLVPGKPARLQCATVNRHGASISVRISYLQRAILSRRESAALFCPGGSGRIRPGFVPVVVMDPLTVQPACDGRSPAIIRECVFPVGMHLKGLMLID
jgi:hypothetical protein